MPVRYTQFEGELSLSEILDDPIIQLVMVRDGIIKDEVEELIRAVHAKLAAIQGRSQMTPRRNDRQTFADIAFLE
jgi:hypothetical protein